MNRLVELRKQKKITQKKVAKDIDVARTTYTRYEIGLRAPDFITLKKLASYFNVSTDYLLEETDDPTPSKEKAPSVMTTEEAIFTWFVLEKGREPTEKELSMFRGMVKPVLDSLPDKSD